MTIVADRASSPDRVSGAVSQNPVTARMASPASSDSRLAGRRLSRRTIVTPFTTRYVATRNGRRATSANTASRTSLLARSSARASRSAAARPSSARARPSSTALAKPRRSRSTPATNRAEITRAALVANTSSGYATVTRRESARRTNSPAAIPSARPMLLSPAWRMAGSAGQGLGDSGDDHLERRALPGGAVHADRAVVGFGDGLNDGQAEPEPAGLAVAGRLGAGEPAEDPAKLGGRDAGARIPHGEHHLPAALQADADFDGVAGLGMGDSVLQQGVQGRDQPVTVAEHGRLGHLT